MNQWKDFESILTKTANWNQDAIENAHSDFKKKESLLKDKIKDLELHLEESGEKIVALTQRIQHLVSNYAAFEPVLELKNHLTQKVEDLEKEKICLTEALLAKEQHFQELLETTINTNEEKLHDLQISSNKKLETKETEWKMTIETEKDRIKILETTLAGANVKHEISAIASKRQHHEELEKLRGQISHLQMALSSKNMTNLDLFANKLQCAKEEFEQSLRDKNEEIREMKIKLKTTEDNNRYLNLVAVVRNVPDDQYKQISDCSSLCGNKFGSESEVLTKSKEANKTKNNIGLYTKSEAEKENLKDSSYDRDINVNMAKLSKKRKLFSVSSVLL